MTTERDVFFLDDRPMRGVKFHKQRWTGRNGSRDGSRDCLSGKDGSQVDMGG